MKKLTVSVLAMVMLFSGVWLCAQEWQHRAVLLTDASKDETTLWLRDAAPLAVDRLLLLESRDGSTRETYEVLHVYEDHVVLKERLREKYEAGARIFQ